MWRCCTSVVQIVVRLRVRRVYVEARDGGDGQREVDDEAEDDVEGGVRVAQLDRVRQAVRERRRRDAGRHQVERRQHGRQDPDPAGDEDRAGDRRRHAGRRTVDGTHRVDDYHVPLRYVREEIPRVF